MVDDPIISVSGLRGIVGRGLTATVAAEYGCAFGAFLGASGATKPSAKPAVCIGRDSRGSGQMVASAVQAGLCSVGVDVIDLGLTMTPSVGIMVTQLACSGGVVITASHNPIEYNGIKLLLGTGMAPPVEKAGQIKTWFLERQFEMVTSPRCGQVTVCDQANEVHVEKVLKIVDRNTIARRRYRVLLDSVNGAGGPITKRLLAALGCQVHAVNDEPTGLFGHVPEPTAENLTGFCDIVRNAKADVGFAQDPDGDRLAIVDENGRYIGEEYTLALAAKYVFSKTCGTAAANLSTSRMIDDIVHQVGGTVIRTPVGEANVAEAMLKTHCVIGGEGNGGVIDLRVGPIRDSLVAIALVLQLMAETGKTIGGLADEIDRYYMVKDKFVADKDAARRILDSARQIFKDAALNAADGYRFDFADGWVHLRTSNTEPVMRLIVEAKDGATARSYADAILRIRDEVLGRRVGASESQEIVSG